jgi:hypothetical protein
MQALSPETPLARDVNWSRVMKPSPHTNAVVQALVACRARRELKGTPRDTPEERQATKAALWARLDARLSTWDPNAETMAQWALHVLSAPSEPSRAA